MLVSTSQDGFSFNPSPCPIPMGVVVAPGGTYTFPVVITVPNLMQNGTYQLRFSLANTLQTRTGPVTIPFGEPMTFNVNVGTLTTTGQKMGMKAFTLSSTPSASSPRQFTTVKPTVKQNKLANATVIRNFNVITRPTVGKFPPG
jgi:hypothetical protein